MPYGRLYAKVHGRQTLWRVTVSVCNEMGTIPHSSTPTMIRLHVNPVLKPPSVKCNAITVRRPYLPPPILNVFVSARPTVLCRGRGRCRYHADSTRAPKNGGSYNGGRDDCCMGWCGNATVRVAGVPQPSDQPFSGEHRALHAWETRVTPPAAAVGTMYLFLLPWTCNC